MVVKNEVTEFKIGELVWLNVQRWIPDMKYNIAEWVGPCKIVFMSRRGLFELSYKVNNEFVKFDCIHPQFLKRFCDEPL